MIKQVLIIMFTAAMTACGQSDNIIKHEHNHAEPEHADNNHEHHDGEIVLHQHKAEELGVKTAIAEIDTVGTVIKVTGEVVADPAARSIITAATSGVIDLNNGLTVGSKVSKGQQIGSISAEGLNGGDQSAAALINLDAAKAELDRITPLRELGIATVQEYNAAKQAYEQALNAVGKGNTRKAASPISGIVDEIFVTNGQFVSAGDQIATVVKDGNSVLRADVPRRYAGEAHSFNNAIVKLSYLKNPIKASLSSISSMSGNNVSPFIPVYFTLEGGNSIIPGSYAEVYIEGGERKNNITLPLEAVSERLGQKFVYVKADEDCYERRPVTVGESNGERVIIESGIKAGEEIVVEGVTFVKLAETSGVAPEGHTH